MALDFSNFSSVNFNPVAFDSSVNLAPGAVDLANSLYNSESSGSTAGASSGNKAPQPYPKRVFELKEKLLRPALTSHYQCWFNPPDRVRSWLSERGFNYNFNTELISLSCSEASLPGSSLMTNEITDDYHGVTERHAYRRQYDDRADFTFYVDHGRSDGNYNIIWFFENWISFVVNEQYALGVEDEKYSYRVNFPDTYQSSTIYIHKFERDFTGQYLEYRFLQAYPISIASMPVSYDSSQLLKCTVSFTYTRYLTRRNALSIPRQEPSQQTANGVPNPSITLYGPRATDVPQTVPLDPNRPTLAQLYDGIGG